MHDSEGVAKFDKSTSLLVITVPVIQSQRLLSKDAAPDTKSPTTADQQQLPGRVEVAPPAVVETVADHLSPPPSGGGGGGGRRRKKRQQRKRNRRASDPNATPPESPLDTGGDTVDSEGSDEVNPLTENYPDEVVETEKQRKQQQKRRSGPTHKVKKPWTIPVKYVPMSRLYVLKDRYVRMFAVLFDFDYS